MFDLALVTRGNDTIGWGHAARMYALALEAEKRRLRTVLVTDTPEVVGWREWPCAVAIGDGANIHTPYVVTDGYEAQTTYGVVWSTVEDYPDPAWTSHDHTIVAVRPHFGDGPHDKVPTLCGPRWMPLERKPWECSNPTKAALTYRPGTATVGAIEGAGLCPLPVFVLSTMEVAVAVVPPSTIAYECMAAGIPVLLHDDAVGHTPEMDAALKRVGKAMIEAGAAVKFTPEALEATLNGSPGGARLHRMVDGFGAGRLLDYIVGAA